MTAHFLMTLLKYGLCRRMYLGGSQMKALSISAGYAVGYDLAFPINSIWNSAPHTTSLNKILNSQPYRDIQNTALLTPGLQYRSYLH